MNMNSKESAKQFDITNQSMDDLIHKMDENLAKEVIRDEMLLWIGLLMHLSNAVLLKRDGYDIEAAAAACAYAFDNPCRKESEQEIIIKVYSLRDEILATARKNGVCNNFTPEELIEATKAGRLIHLQKQIQHIVLCT